ALLAPELLHELRKWRVAGPDGRESRLVGELVIEAPGDRIGPVATRVIEQASVAVVVRLAVVGESILVAAVGEHVSEQLEQRPGMAQLVLRDRADGDVLLEQRRDARPLG